MSSIQIWNTAYNADCGFFTMRICMEGEQFVLNATWNETVLNQLKSTKISDITSRIFAVSAKVGMITQENEQVKAFISRDCPLQIADFIKNKCALMFIFNQEITRNNVKISLL